MVGEDLSEFKPTETQTAARVNVHSWHLIMYRISLVIRASPHIG